MQPPPLRGGIAIIPSRPVLQQVLDEYGLAHVIDDDGDLVVRWDNCSIYLFHYGDRREVLQARLYINRRFEVELRSSLIEVLDDWNRTKLFPKAHTVLPDDGMVGICAEHCVDFESGTTRSARKYTVGVWFDTLLRFAEWIDEQV